MQEQREQSEFNMAFSYLNRLNELIYYANYGSRELDAHTWYHALLAWKREISTETNEKEAEQINAIISKLNILVEQNQKNVNKLGRKTINNQTYWLLDMLDTKLRDIMKRSGLLMKTRENPRKALG